MQLNVYVQKHTFNANRKKKRKIRALLRIHLALSTVIQGLITVVYRCVYRSLSFAWKAGLVNEVRSQSCFPEPACSSFDDTSTVTEDDFSTSPGYKRRPYWPRIAGYRIVPSPTDRHRDAYWHTVCERCSRDSEPSVLLCPWFSRLTAVTFERLSVENFLRDFASAHG